VTPSVLTAWLIRVVIGALRVCACAAGPALEGGVSAACGADEARGQHSPPFVPRRTHAAAPHHEGRQGGSPPARMTVAASTRCTGRGQSARRGMNVAILAAIPLRRALCPRA